MEITVTISDGKAGKWQKVLKKKDKYIVDCGDGSGPDLFDQEDFVGGITGMILGMLEREEDELARKSKGEKDGKRIV